MKPEKVHILSPSETQIRRLVEELKIPAMLARLLINRQMSEPEDAHAFLKQTLADLTDPFLLRDMDKAVTRIADGVAAKDKILVFGDYDVDGVTATALLIDFFRQAGVHANAYIPHRIQEGYSLGPEHVHRMILPSGYNLIVTVDCGVSSHQAVAAAQAAGVDVVITDHHQVPDRLPEAHAIVNPKRPDCPAGLEDLAGVGVAFYLTMALRQHLRNRNYWQNRAEPNLKAMCDLVAMGTVADLVPLRGVNRILVKAGLQVLSKGHRPGIRALLEKARIKKQTLDAEDISFRLAPRINAAGRMGHAETAFRLLSTDSDTTARQKADELEMLNQRRQQTESQLADHIEGHLRQHPELLNAHSLALADESWHQGVLGIAAARLARRFHRPVFLIAIDGKRGKGSGRSVADIHLVEALDRCQKHLLGYGGHSMAAGLSIGVDQLPAFVQAFDRAVAAQGHDTDAAAPFQIEEKLKIQQIDARLLEIIQHLEPFGSENPEPLFISEKLTATADRIVGGHHRQMLLQAADDPGGRTISAIQFHVDLDQPLKSSGLQLAYRLRWNHWNGKKQIQMVVEKDFPVHPIEVP